MACWTARRPAPVDEAPELEPPHPASAPITSAATTAHEPRPPARSGHARRRRPPPGTAGDRRASAAGGMCAGTICRHGDRRDPAPASGHGRQGRRPDPIRRAGPRAVHRGGPARGDRRPARTRSGARRVPVHARDLRVDVPRAAVDDAPVRRLRHERGDQRALPLPARPRPDRAVDRVRHALADGPRLRSSRARSARSGARAWRSTRSTTCRRCSPGSTSARCRVSMTINAPAAIMLAFYVAAAEQDGDGAGGAVPAEQLSGTIQADILKEYIAQKEWCFPIDPAMRLCGDMIEWCTHHMPRWHPISISGYHIREAGSTAQQELAFTLKDGLTYVEQAVERGPGRRRLRAAAVVLLQRPDRLLRGDRQVPRRPAHLGARAARDLRRQEPALVADALPLPDGRRQPDRPAAAQQHRAHRRSRRSPACSAARSRCTPTPTTRRSRCRPRRRSRSRCAPSR